MPQRRRPSRGGSSVSGERLRRSSRTHQWSSGLSRGPQTSASTGPSCRWRASVPSSLADRMDRGERRPDRHPFPPASAGRATRWSCDTVARRLLPCFNNQERLIASPMSCPAKPALRCPSSPFSMSHSRSMVATLRLICEVDGPHPHLLNDFWLNSGLRQHEASPCELAEIIRDAHRTSRGTSKPEMGK
jgi:hypothetical protein